MSGEVDSLTHTVQHSLF